MRTGDDLVDLAGAAAIMGVSASTVRHRVGCLTLRPVIVGGGKGPGKWWFLRADVEDLRDYEAARRSRTAGGGPSS